LWYLGGYFPKTNSYRLVLLSKLRQEVTMRKFGTRVAITPALLSFFLAASLVFSSALHAQAPFYQGKSITLIGNQPAANMIFGHASSLTI
jgi:hypothetical protein